METVGVGKELKEVKHNTYTSFSEVLKALEEGKMCRRVYWDAGNFIFRQVPSSVDYQFIEKMSSLPQSVKEEFKKRFENFDKDSKKSFDIRYRNQLALVNSSNSITSYSITVEDAFASDWEILD